jgi:GAF domain-containing protein
MTLQAARPALPAGAFGQLSSGRPVILRNQVSTKQGKPASLLLLPLMLQGQLIGTVGIEKADPDYEWGTEELSIAENAAAQASLALENARLLEETQRRAAKERTIGEISARIGGLVDVEKLLQATVQELSQTLPNAEVAIQFQRSERG